MRHATKAGGVGGGEIGLFKPVLRHMDGRRVVELENPNMEDLGALE